ncbi:MAG: hypothetical protein ABI416_00110 [Ginsengibacter sp.]
MSILNLQGISKTKLVTRCICLFWLIAKIISWKLWLAERFFPVVPPFNFLFVPSSFHLVLFILSLAALFALMIFPSNRRIQVSVVIIEVLSCLLDQNRWQPWEYEYIFIILALATNYKNEKITLSIIAFIIVSIYFFSGISKLNPVFSISIRNDLVRYGIANAGRSPFYEWLQYHAGYLLGAIELSLSIGLLFGAFRKISAVFLIMMHLLILAILGPFGINYDKIIWPWNTVMIIILCVFFISKPGVAISFQSMKKGWNKLIVILFGILPFLNFFGYWDFYLSSSLFSSRPPGMYICIHNVGSAKVLQSFFAPFGNKIICDSNSTLINVRDWSFEEMQSPVYPEIRIYKSIKKQLLTRYPDMNATFVVNPYIDGMKRREELK